MIRRISRSSALSFMLYISAVITLSLLWSLGHVSAAFVAALGLTLPTSLLVPPASIVTVGLVGIAVPHSSPFTYGLTFAAAAIGNSVLLCAVGKSVRKRRRWRSIATHESHNFR